MENNKLTYEKLIERAMFSEFPRMRTTPDVVFEAVVDEIIGTKQRRFGPRPSPEIQVAIRDVVRGSEVVTFFVPWASRKQADGAPLDVLEFFAIKQLQSLQRVLADFGQACNFVFRVEDLADLWLFPGSEAQVVDYAVKFGDLVRAMIPGAIVNSESSRTVTHKKFRAAAEVFEIEFMDHFNKGAKPPAGWGDFTTQQLEHYRKLYDVLYPNADPIKKMAQYFAGVTARNHFGVRREPDGKFIPIYFGHPVPGDPSAGHKLFYRTLRCSHTHNHAAPWMARGYFRIQDGSNETCPRFADDDTKLSPALVKINGVDVYTPYEVL